ncbi:DUF2989 domain-containing protein [Alteromonas sp. KUL49]|uniref:DUF2989 domain-containing protein n=1 Tax=Alteromonas sp. KUL49 TaxID=2480798 RepID=UPI00215B26EE|nr:DUF2989 domain-containing protein [Alteromonas sp. KUL49]
MKQAGNTKLLISFKNTIKTIKNTAIFSNIPTFSKYLSLAVVISLSLSGCSDMFKPTIAEICETHSEFCLDLNLDARCRYDRADIIRLRYEHKDDPSDAYKYPLMLAFEEYLVCVEEAQHIEHIKRRGKEATRLKGVLTAQQELSRLARETKTSPDPYLSYYHWSRFNDRDALSRFESYAQRRNIDDPNLLVILASLQIKYDNALTTQTLYRALSIYKDSSDIDVSIFHSLVSIALDDDKFQMAYVWLSVAESFDDKIPSLERELLGEAHGLPTDILDDVADDIVWALRREEFDANALRLNRL